MLELPTKPGWPAGLFWVGVMGRTEYRATNDAAGVGLALWARYPVASAGPGVLTRASLAC